MISETKGLNPKYLAYLIVINFVFVSLWAGSLILDTVVIGSSYDTPFKALEYVKIRSLLFYFTYTNALLLTIINILIFIAFYSYYCNENIFTRTTALVFTIIYGFMNIFSYGSQLFILPYLINILGEHYSSQADAIVLLFIHIYPFSIVSIINLCAYGVFSIPSIIFGWFLFNENDKYKKIGGLLFILSAIIVFISIIALLFLQPEIAGLFSIFGGFLSLISYVPLILAFLRVE